MGGREPPATEGDDMTTTTRTYSITSKASGAELGPYTADSPEGALRALAADSGGEHILAALDAGDLWTCMGEHGMRGELGDLDVRPLPTDPAPRCASAKAHQEECWWAALEATAQDGDSVERPDHAHQSRATAYQREHCSR